MKPFNLAEALAGKPVINGTGEKVTITRLSRSTDLGQELVSQDLCGRLLGYHKLDGVAQYNTMYSLYMAPTTVTKWVNIYNSVGWTAFHNSEEAANKAATTGGDHKHSPRWGNKAHLVTYEE